MGNGEEECVVYCQITKGVRKSNSVGIKGGIYMTLCYIITYKKSE